MTDSPKLPYLFLDVDGVLNRVFAFGGDWDDFHKSRLQPFHQGNFSVHLSPSMGAALVALPVEIHWLTTWSREANRLIGPIVGIPECPVAGIGDPDPNSKLECLEIVMERDPRPFIWIDDDAIPHDAARVFADRGWDAFVVRPETNVGITHEHIALIKEFLARERGT